MNETTLSGATVDNAAEILRRETQEGPGPTAVSLWQLIDELGQLALAPVSAIGLLELIEELIADPRIDLVNEFDRGMPMIEFAWAGERA